MSSPASVPITSVRPASSSARATVAAALDLGAHDDERAVALDAVDEAANRLERQGAAVAVDEVARAVGADRAPHAEHRHVARERRLRGTDAARAEPAQELALAGDGPPARGSRGWRRGAASEEGIGSGYQRPDAAVGEELRHHAVGRAPVDDVHGPHAAGQRMQDRLRLDVHAPLDALAELRLEIGRLDLAR